MQHFITDRLPQIQELCRTHHVRQLHIFGSAVRTDFNSETSDVDLRVEFISGADVSNYAKNYHALLDSLVEVLGRKVDLLSGRIENPYIRAAIEKDKVLIYAA